MKQIDLNDATSSRLRVTRFPDGQLHANIMDIAEGDSVSVVCSITSSDKMILLLEVANALDNLFAKKTELIIPYLMGARYDRLMLKGDSVDLKVFASLINSMGFQKVYLYDAHSDTALQLIDRSVNISNAELVKQYKEQNAVLICPDAGASKKVNQYFEWNPNLTDIVHCSKTRDLTNGNLTLKVLEPERCAGRNCVIIDDICDGGGTFTAIADHIQPKHLTLIVTHGIFSKGFDVLSRKFDKIIVSNSYQQSYDCDIIEVHKHGYPFYGKDIYGYY